jgi:hypothetical protein
MQSQLMTCHDIAIEIFGKDENGKLKRCVRVIAERDSVQPDFPKPVHGRKKGKTLYFKRYEIMAHYGLELAAA